MDRGIPTEEVLAEMRAAETPVYYLVGTPKGRLSRFEEALTAQPWATLRDDISETFSVRQLCERHRQKLFPT